MSAFNNTDKNKTAVYIAIPFALSMPLWGILKEVTHRPVFTILLISCAVVVLLLCSPLNWYLNRKKGDEE